MEHSLELDETMTQNPHTTVRDIVTMTSPSLNRMVLHALSQLNGKPYLTAREIRALLKEQFDAEYQIQTIIVVLNRFCVKKTVTRCTFAGPEVRERYGYYIPVDSDSFRETKLRERLCAIADEFYAGDSAMALEALNKLKLA
jgi:predicted transcriptional regulator